jgi:hypothetical protein
MIKEHPSFFAIPDETVLWQYMSLTKFLFFIKNKKLHLHRIDDLMDKEEGVLSVLDKKMNPYYDDTKEWNDYLEKDRKRSFISCWINSPQEQSLMWYAYGKDGVAIRTTACSIRCAMEIDMEHEVHLIAVRYIDKREECSQIEGTSFNWLRYPTTKRKFFELENEVRLLYYDVDRKYKNIKGIDFDVKIDDLIQEIRVSSSLPEYVFNLICQEVEDAGISIKPIRSEI